ncbi:MAG: putative penicillin-binding protein, partial [Candidatus Paceibacter sp.]|nr:putative penicillin-binding protein [Candidatus Paceibacter sp.]
TWAGNNDNSAMVKKTSGLIIAPLWRAFMNEALKKYPATPFKQPEPIDPTLKSVLRGIWQGGQTYVIDRSSGKLATDQTPPELRQEMAVPGGIHSILYWIDKNDPKGPPPANPYADSQFELWEKPIQAWANANGGQAGTPPPTQTDDVHNPESAPRISITSPVNGNNFVSGDQVNVSISYQGRFPIQKVEYYLNNQLIGTAVGENPNFSFWISQTPQVQNGLNTLRAVAYDNVQNKGEASVSFNARP